MIGQYEQLKADIAEVIRENGRQEITGDILQQVLLGMVGELGGGATFAGIAEPQPRAEALTPDNDVFYFAFDKGAYGQFGGLSVDSYGSLNVVYIKDGEWTLATYGERWKEVTYQELVSLSRNHKLIPGMSYRITDYETIVNPSLQDVQSASHHFDVVVTALTETVLDEDARAVHRNSEPYFRNSRVQLWRLKYALIGYDQSYDWVDNANNKGVIYFMRDEFGNECGYDFKNIQFKRWNVIDNVEGRNVHGYMGVLGNLAEGLTIPDEDDWRWAYTFDNNGEDASLQVVGNIVALDNIISAKQDESGKKELPNNVFYGIVERNKLGYNCDNNTFRNADGNTFGSECGANSIMTLRTNTIGSNFSGNSGVLLQDNTMGNSVYLNKWKTVSGTNIGNFVTYNAWENVQYSTIGNDIGFSVIENTVVYVQILDGVSGASGSPITIPFDSDAGTDVQCVGMIGGAVKVWKPAEEDKVDIVSASGATLAAQVGKYYTLSSVGTLAVTLPTIASGTTKVQTVTFYISAGSTPAVTWTSTHTIIFADGFQIEANGLYEISAAWNGIGWIIGMLKLVAQSS